MKIILMSKIIKRNIFCLGIVILLSIVIYCCTHKSDSHGARTLFDFEEEAELDLFHWKCKTLFSLSEEYAKHGSRSLRIEFYPTRQVGFSTGQIDHDWSRIRAFEFTVFNKSEKTIKLYLQISDDTTKGDPLKAYTKALSIASGDNVIIVPISELCDSFSRKLNARNIKGFYIFMREIPVRTILYFDYFRLI
jgi:hypothetical protein